VEGIRFCPKTVSKSRPSPDFSRDLQCGFCKA